MATTRISRPGVLVVFGLWVVAAAGGCAIQYSWGPFGGGPRSVPSPPGQPPVCTHRRQVLDPVCYGYKPTCWMAWPGNCPVCPPPYSCQQEPQPQVAPERQPEELPVPKLPPAPDKALPGPTAPAKPAPETAPLPPEPMPAPQPGPLGVPATPIPLNGADKQPQKQNGKEAPAGQRQRNGQPNGSTPAKPAERPAPADDEPVPPKPPTPQTEDQGRSRVGSVTDGVTYRTDTKTNSTSTSPQATQQPAQRRTNEIAVRVSLGAPIATSAPEAQLQTAQVRYSHLGNIDSRSVYEQAVSAARVASSAQDVAQAKASVAAIRNSTEHDRQASASRVVATGNIQNPSTRGNGAQVNSVQRSAPAATSTLTSAKAKTVAGSTERNPNLPTLAERLAQQAAESRHHETASSQAVVAGQRSNASKLSVSPSNGRSPSGSQLARTQPAPAQSVAAPQPPPLRTLGESKPPASPAADGKVAAANADLLLLGYRSAEK